MNRLMGSTGLALVGAVSALATLLNPFGIDAWRYVVGLAANPSVSGRVSEWRPPWPLDPAGAIFYLSLAAVVVIVALRLRADRRLTPSTIAPVATLAVFGILGVVTGRGLAWWALAGPIAAATLAHESALVDQLPRALRPLRSIFAASPRGREERRSPANGVLVLALLAAGIALLPLWRPVGPAGVPIGTLSHAPQGVARELQELVAHGDLPNRAHVWNPQPWGSWLEFAVPETLVYVDSRIELFPASFWTDDEFHVSNFTWWQAALGAMDVRAVVLSAGQDPRLAEALEASGSGWELAYRDAEGSIFIRSTP
jgi:hypothetical protein